MSRHVLRQGAAAERKSKMRYAFKQRCDVNVGEECREKHEWGVCRRDWFSKAGPASCPIWSHAAATKEIEAVPAPPGSVISAEPHPPFRSVGLP